MSRPFFVRHLTRTERAQILKLRKHPPNLDVYRRPQTVHMSSQRLKVQQIAGIVSRSRLTVTRWLHQFNAHGLPALWPGKSTGRPPRADADFQAALAEAVARNPQDMGYPFTRWSVDLLTEHLRRKTHIDVSASTVYHVLKRLGYRYGCPKLDLKHRQDPKDVKRAKRQTRAALKKRKPAPVVVLSRIVTKLNSISIQDCPAAGAREADG